MKVVCQQSGSDLNTSLTSAFLCGYIRVSALPKPSPDPIVIVVTYHRRPGWDTWATFWVDCR